MSGFEQTGDGAVYTTVEDLAKWDRNFYEPKVGGQALVDGLLRSGVLNDGKSIPYAAGLLNGTHKGLRVVSHGGSWAGYRAELVRFPKQQLSVICLCNRADGNPSAKARQVADLYLASELTAAPAPQTQAPAAKPETSAKEQRPAPTAAELTRLAGTYYSEELDTTARLTVKNDRLVYNGPAGRPRPLEPFARDTFRSGPWQFEVLRNASGDVEGFLLHAGRIRGLRFTRR